MEKISIIVPVYNVKDYLEECVDSLLAQTYPNTEIILVNDGSTDESPEICKEYAANYENVRVENKINGGLSDARNYGVKKASGEYLMFIDSDDTLERTACEVLYRALKEENADIAIGDLYKEDAKGIRNEQHYVYTAEAAICEMLKETSFNTSACGKLFKKELFSEILFPVGKLYEDLGTVYKVLDRAEKVVYLPYELYYYRTRGNSITQEAFHHRKMDLFLLTDEMIMFLEKKYPQAVLPAVNRRTRYAISFLSQIANSRTGEKEDIKKLCHYVRKNIISYLRSPYKITSKMFGVCIVFNYSFAAMIMRRIRR